MAELKVDKDKGEVKIEMNREILEKVEKLLSEFEKLKKVPKVDWEKVLNNLVGGETEVKLQFDKFTIDGAVTFKCVPLKKE